LSNTKLIKNALCTDWPSYFLGNKNAVVINKTGEMALIKNASNKVSFAPQNLTQASGKPIKPILKSGMSVDSPFHTKLTFVHPSTKQLLDYNESRRESLNVHSIEKLSLE